MNKNEYIYNIQWILLSSGIAISFTAFVWLVGKKLLVVLLFLTTFDGVTYSEYAVIVFSLVFIPFCLRKTVYINE